MLVKLLPLHDGARPIMYGVISKNSSVSNDLIALTIRDWHFQAKSTSSRLASRFWHYAEHLTHTVFTLFSSIFVAK